MCVSGDGQSCRGSLTVAPLAPLGPAGPCEKRNKKEAVTTGEGGDVQNCRGKVTSPQDPGATLEGQAGETGTPRRCWKDRLETLQVQEHMGDTGASAC